MGSLNRTVQGWIGDVLYVKLGEEPRTEVAWNLLRGIIGEELFGTEFVPVPFIESASYFNQMFVFTKKSSILSALGFRPPTYKIIGNLDYLVNRDASTWTPQVDFSQWDVADGYRMFNLQLTSRLPGVEKSIEFKAFEPRIRRTVPPTPGSVKIHRNLLEDLKGVKTLYVITDVVLANYVKFSVKIGNQYRTFIHDRGMPLGFKYKKYRLQSDGTFIAEMHTTLKRTERQAKWLQPLPQPVPPAPNMPRWDFMLRRYHNGPRRKIKNNLTIPASFEGIDDIMRQHRQHGTGGSLVRLERPVLNDAVRQDRDMVHVNDIEAEEAWRLNERLGRFVLNPRIRRIGVRGTVSMETMRGSD